MNIAIIEKGHFEVAYTLLSLFDNGYNRITIFIDGESGRQLELMLGEKMKQYTWVVQQWDESNRQFISRIFQSLNRQTIDLIYFDTIEDNFIVYAYFLNRLKANKIILTLHDINGFFHYKPAFSLRRLVRFAGKNMLIRMLPAFNVLSETLMDNLSSKLPPSKKIFNIPGSFFEQRLYVPLSYLPGETLNITIPGSVDTRRRNYDLVFDLLNAANDRKLKISITLLGAFKKGFSERIRERCQEHMKTSNNLKFYQFSIVDQPEFDKMILASHFIWMPLHQETMIADGVKEQYGTSTCSGNIADAIKHVKPFFLPASVAIDPILENSCIRYSSVEELAGILERFTQEGYNTLQKNAYQVSLYYTKENIISRNTDLFKAGGITTSRPS